ncbi:sulfite exporter TauE/SafE family protein [Maritalea mobilis]|uniref:sulfite exporter TauE/SafE family protein n=1 Tax=Maritalea mobilis TaxID=483324 RepID=UPI001C979FE7|nr:sulfite exporter TauE/SafE family protein [Maritalea mobilis]MBY6200217.1 sulfite exporter TauE/SafE family protein [Maritalea mobilis]
MLEALTTLPEGLSALGFWVLMATSFIASLITAALGIGGGALMIAVMAILVPPAALIPVHGAVQLASNAGRMSLLLGHVQWSALKAFTVGSIAGAILGGLVVVELPPWVIQLCIGCFVIWTVLARPPRWLSAWPLVTGAISSFLTMFFGATGLFVAGYTKSLILPRHGHVATHAALMTVQHGLKLVVFGALGFAFGAWAWVIIALSLAGLAGTAIGKVFLGRMTDHGFRRVLDILLILISLRLIWQAVTQIPW